jgi:hypothetical protein
MTLVTQIIHKTLTFFVKEKILHKYPYISVGVTVGYEKVCRNIFFSFST